MCFGVIIIVGTVAFILAVIWACGRAAGIADDLADAFNDWVEKRKP